ncbi:MAG: alpha/beta hydrolase [Burkholderiales bacterium]
MPFISVTKVRLYYELHGSGPRLLYISGTGADLRLKPNIFDWPPAKQFEILAFDQRGMGQSDKPNIPYSMQDYADDAAALLDAVGWDDCLVWGYSFGGMVAQELALRYPHRIRKVVLAATSSGGAGGSSFPLHQLQFLPPEKYGERMVELNDTRHDAAWRASHAQVYASLLQQQSDASKVGAGEAGREIGARRQIEARKLHHTYDRLPQLTMPVYICGGLYDGICPTDNLLALKKQIPNSILEVFDGGHRFFLQDDRAFRRISGFLLE